MGTDFTVDWSPLANLGKTFREAQQRNILAELGTSTDPEAFDRVGRKLLAGGDLQGGMSLVALGQKLGDRKATEELAKSFGGLFGSPQATPQTAPQTAPRPQSSAPASGPVGPVVLDESGKPAAKDAEGVYGENAVMMPPGEGTGTDPRHRDLLIRTVFGEAGNQAPEGQAAVAAVVKNRMQAGRYGGSDVPGVVLAKGQFEPWSNPEAKAGMLALSPEDPRYQKIGAIVDQVLAGQMADPTGGATHFYAPRAQAALGRQPPAWAAGQGQQIGDHTFYAPEGRVQVAQAGGGPVPTQQQPPVNRPDSPQLPEAKFAGRPVEDWVKVMGPLAMNPRAPEEVRKFATEFVNSALKGTELTPHQKDYRSYGLQEIAAGRVPKTEEAWDTSRRRASAVTEGDQQLKARIHIDTEAVKDLSKKVVAGRSAIPALDRIIEIARKTPEGFAGTVSPFIAKTLSAAGIEVPEGISNAELMQSLSRQFIPAVRDPGAASNYEQTLYAAAVPGLSQSADGRLKIAGMFKELIKREAQVLHIYRNNIGSPDLDKKLAELDATPIFTPEIRKMLEREAQTWYSRRQCVDGEGIPAGGNDWRKVRCRQTGTGLSAQGCFADD
jgi:spore germination cell wall hydrolase CwlJ-like protein